MGSYCMDSGMVYYVFRDRSSCCLGQHFHRSRFRFRVPAREIWFDMIWPFSKRIIRESFRSPLFDRNSFTEGQKSFTWVHLRTSGKSNFVLIDVFMEAR